MKLSRQLLVIHSVIIFLLVLGYAWLSLLNVRQLSIQELVNQSNTAAQYLAEPIRQGVLEDNAALYQAKIDVFYDGGNYARISLYSTDDANSLLYERNNLTTSVGVPAWFIRVLPIEPIVGYQELYKGIIPVGVLEVQIHPYAFYQFVWQQFVDMTSVTIFVGLIAWILGLALINIVLQPVMLVKRQAAAVAHKHYPQIKRHSGIAEFEQLIEAHNEMTEQIKVLFSQHQQHMTELKHKLYHDSGSGLPNRIYFNLTLTDLLSRTSKRIAGGLVIIHLPNAMKIKHETGFAQYQAVLHFVIKATGKIQAIGKNCQLFQLNERDLGVLLLHQDTAQLVDFSKRMVRILEDCEQLTAFGGAFLGVTELIENDSQVDIMKRADAALKYGMANDKRFYMDQVAGGTADLSMFSSKQTLLDGLANGIVDFFMQPVVSPDEHKLLFTELYTRLSIDDQDVSLAEVLTLAEKFEVTAVLDKLILTELQTHYQLGALNGKVSLNVSAFSFHSIDFQAWLFELLDQTPGLAHNLIMEFDEIDLSHCVQARELSYKLANYGVNVAIDHFGRGSSSLARISDMKIHWLKIDSRYIHEESSNANKDYLTMICELVEKLGVKAIIPNVETLGQLNLARAVGCSGVQGYFIAKPQALYEKK